MVKDKLYRFKNKFDYQLKEKLDQEAEKFGNDYKNLINEIKRITFAGGKRLRPALVYWGFEAVGGEGFEKVMDACFSTELFQTFALIHDDIMDKSGKRRGVITTWKKWNINKALLIGDLCFSLADEYFPVNRERRYWNLLKKETCLGQYLDNQDFVGFSQKQVKKILDYKTARYTIARPLQIGAFCKTKDKGELKVLFDYGQKMGIAFQIRDDLLGVFGDKTKTGKPIGDDISEGKKTLLTVRLFAKKRIIKKTELKKFKKLFGSNKKLSKRENEFIINLYKKYNINKEVSEEMKKEAERAKRIIMDSDLEKKENLMQIADFIVRRES
jgi:geranylgeranyl diphosphate synthase type I